MLRPLAAVPLLALAVACDDEDLLALQDPPPEAPRLEEPAAGDDPVEAPPAPDEEPIDEAPDAPPVDEEEPVDEPPPPQGGFLPDCGDARTFDLAAACGVSFRAIFLSPSGSPNGEGTEDDPVPDLGRAIDRCGGLPCHIRAATGAFSTPSTTLPPCTYVEGGFDASSAPWQETTGRTRFVGGGAGALLTMGAGTILERVDLEASGAGVALTPGFAEIVDGVIDAAGDGVLASGRGDGGARAYLCRADVNAGGDALRIEDGDVDGFYAEDATLYGARGLVVAGASSDVEVVGGVLRGAEVDASLSGGSHHVTIEDAVLDGQSRAVDMTADVHDVVIRGNTIRAAPPAADPARNVVVQENDRP